MRLMAGRSAVAVCDPISLAVLESPELLARTSPWGRPSRSGCRSLRRPLRRVHGAREVREAAPRAYRRGDG